MELIITLAMAAILIGIALPAFNDFMRQRAMISRVNDMVVAITYARSEAVRQGRAVSVVAAAPTPVPPLANEWGGGYCVVPGTPADCAGADVLRRFEGFDDATLTSSNGATALVFNARGLLVADTPIVISLCSTDENVDPGRVVNINRTGRADTAELECHG
ncbi:MAG: GspH/FimT family pseudopilin [Pseudomonadales bacterium]|nr:GspH/FimT family pseudopilin [Pseudomonadales bacterium]